MSRCSPPRAAGRSEELGRPAETAPVLSRFDDQAGNRACPSLGHGAIGSSDEGVAAADVRHSPDQTDGAGLPLDLPDLTRDFRRG
jgi:hypothetical protein